MVNRTTAAEPRAQYSRRSLFAGAGVAALGGALVPSRADAQSDFVPISQMQPTAPDGPVSTTVFEIAPSDPSKAPFRLVLGGTDFFGIRDTVMYFGYNAGDLGGKVMQTEPSFTFVIEQDYFQNGTEHTLESYFEFTNTSGSISYRPIFMQFDRDTGYLNAFQFTSPSVVFRGLPIAAYTEAPPYMVVQSGVISLTPSTGPAQISLNVQPGQQSYLTMQSSGESAFTVRTLSPNQVAFDVGGTGMVYMFRGVGVAINAYERSASLLVASTNGGRVTAIRQGRSQVGSLLELQDSSEAVLSRFDKNGCFMTRMSMAPADADLANDELAMWFDSTPGAAKVMFKGKDRSGTVLSAAISLSTTAA